MTLLDILVLAIIQGITEFLPISSSAHLILWPLLTGRPDQGLEIDLGVHLGTLAAVCLYFRADVGRMLVGAGHVLTGRVRTPEARLTLLLVLATLPAIIVGLALKVTGGADALRSLAVIGWATVIGAILLWLADRTVVSRGAAEGWLLSDAILMGCMQATALIPGASRSGITMTTARWLGYDRVQGARLSLLMAVPVTLAAVTLGALDVIREGDAALGAQFVLGAVLSFVAALAALAVMMRMFAASWTMLPFVAYRLALGAVLLAIVYL